MFRLTRQVKGLLGGTSLLSGRSALSSARPMSSAAYSKLANSCCGSNTRTTAIAANHRSLETVLFRTTAVRAQSTRDEKTSEVPTSVVQDKAEEDAAAKEETPVDAIAASEVVKEEKSEDEDSTLDAADATAIVEEEKPDAQEQFGTPEIVDESTVEKDTAATEEPKKKSLFPSFEAEKLEALAASLERSILEDETKAAVVAAAAKEDVVNEDPQVLEKLAERLRFFFSDPNLRHDSFMRTLMFRKNGTIPVANLMKFKTIEKISQSPATVAHAAKTLCSDTLTVTEEEGGGTHIGRVDQFTPEKMDDNIPVSLYLTNLPCGDEYLCSIDDITSLFPGLTVTFVKLRYKKQPYQSLGSARKRVPLGAALVEFTTVEDLEKAATEYLTVFGGNQIQPAKQLYLKDQPVQVMLLSEYIGNRTQKQLGLQPYLNHRDPLRIKK